jgi:PAS domain S-box-containing protein
MADLPNIKYKSNLLVRTWQKWITPRSVDQDERFRERTIRGMVVIWLAVLVVLAILLIVLDSLWRVNQLVAVFLLTVAAAVTVSKGHLRLAGWLLVLQSLVYAIFSMFQVGYWAPGTFATNILALLLGAMLLPATSARIIPFMLIAIYTGISLWLDAHGFISPLPPSNPFSAPIPASVGFSLIVLTLGGAGSYFLNELTLQRRQLKELVDTLEARVTERTLALQRTNEQLQTEIYERTQVEAALRQSENQLRAILDALPIPVIVATSQENFLYVNPVAVSLFKIDLTSRANAASSFQLEPADQHRVTETVQTQGYATDLEVHYRNAEAARRVGQISIQPFQFSGQAAFLAAIVDITDLKAVQEAERKQRNLTEALLDSALILTSSLQLDEVIQHILSNLNRVIQHDVATILMIDGEYGTVLGLKSNVEGTQYEIVRNRVLIKDEYYHNLMLQTRQPVCLGDISADPRFVRISRNLVIKAFLGLPILAGQEVIGFLNLGSQHPDFFTETHISYLQIFAIQAGIAIQNARLYKQAQTIAVLEERNKLARDLHDSVSQTLFAANSIAEALPQLFNMHPEKAQNYINDLHQLTRGAMAEMRSLLFELRPEALLQTEMAILLAQLCDVFTGQTQIEVDRKLMKKVLLPPDVQIVFYRVAQESLNNIVKYAHASQVSLTLTYTDTLIEMRIKDNGCGFDPQQVPGNHFGLKIMGERAAGIAAQLVVNSQLNQGTEILLRSNIT